MTPDFSPENLSGRRAMAFVGAALLAGRAILGFWRKGGPATAKADGSPVTEADLAANVAILAVLQDTFPEIPVISEESDRPASAAGAERFILVDPLDGTKEFLRGTDEFTVNIALVEAGQPVSGVVYAPASGRIWFGESAGCLSRAWAGAVAPGETRREAISWRSIAVRPVPEAPVAVVSRSHLDVATAEWMARRGIVKQAPSGSSIKFCLIAEGAADVYPRFGRTMEWDTAAGDAVLRAAGGLTTGLSGEAFVYGKADCANPGFVARGATSF
jgi:3'(2'), 5'-bisphosphate nucleotidase